MKTTGTLYSNTDPMLVPICAKITVRILQQRNGNMQYNMLHPIFDKIALQIFVQYKIQAVIVNIGP